MKRLKIKKKKKNCKYLSTCLVSVFRVGLAKLLACKRWGGGRERKKREVRQTWYIMYNAENGASVILFMFVTTWDLLSNHLDVCTIDSGTSPHYYFLGENWLYIFIVTMSCLETWSESSEKLWNEDGCVKWNHRLANSYKSLEQDGSELWAGMA